MSESSATSLETDNQAPWGNVTNPLHHDPKHFRYLIHLDSGQPTPAAPDGKETDGGWQYILESPDRIRSLTQISASLVDQDHQVIFQGTGSSHGLIIEAPASAIIAAHSRDMYAKAKTHDILSNEFPPPHPDQLVADTKPTEWNEIAVSPASVVVKAIFWVNSQADDEPPFEREEVRKMAEVHGLPFLELELIKY